MATDKLTKKRLLKYAIQGIVLGILATAVVMFIFTEPTESYNRLKQFRWDFALLCLGFVLIAWLCNGLRVYILCHSLGYKLKYFQCVCVSLSSEFGIAATPAGVGGAAIRISMLRYAGVPVAIGTTMFAVDVALDAMFFLFILPFTIFSVVRNEKVLSVLPWKSFNDVYPTLIIILILVFLVVLAIRKKLARKIWRRVRHFKLMKKYRVRTRILWINRRLKKEWHIMKKGFSHLFSVRKITLLSCFCVAAVQWCCRYGILSVILLGFGIENNPFLLFIVQGLLFSISLLIVLPGGGGGVEVITALFLDQIYPNAPEGVIVLIWRFMTYHLYLIVGGLVFLFTFNHLHKIFPKADIDEAEAELELVDIEEAKSNSQAQANV